MIGAVPTDAGPTVVLTGRDLRLADVVGVARGSARRARSVASSGCATHAIAERDRRRNTCMRRHDRVGVRKSFTVEASQHDRLLVHQHLIGGPPAPHDAVRATTLRLANALASGTTPARPCSQARRHRAQRRPAAAGAHARLGRSGRPGGHGGLSPRACSTDSRSPREAIA
jgi:hypothetical protein